MLAAHARPSQYDSLFSAAMNPHQQNNNMPPTTNLPPWAFAPAVAAAAAQPDEASNKRPRLMPEAQVLAALAASQHQRVMMALQQQQQQQQFFAAAAAAAQQQQQQQQQQSLPFNPFLFAPPVQAPQFFPALSQPLPARSRPLLVPRASTMSVMASPPVAHAISPKGGGAFFGALKDADGNRRRQRKRESEGSRRTNLNDLVSVVEQAVLRDLQRMDRFADKVTVLECTVRLLQEKYGLTPSSTTSATGPSEPDYDSESSTASADPALDLSRPNLDRSTKKTLRERLRRKLMNRHLASLRRLLKVDETKDKKSVLLAVIDFLNSKQPKPSSPPSSSSHLAKPDSAAAVASSSSSAPASAPISRSDSSSVA